MFAQQTTQTCSTAQPIVIVYGNGIRTTRTQALSRDLPLLQDMVTAALPLSALTPNEITFCLAYDSTYVEADSLNLGLIGEIIDTPLQLFQAFLQLDLQTPQQFWYWWSNAQAAPTFFNQIEQDIGTGIGIGVSSVLQPDILKQLDTYRTAIGNRQIVIVVAHSQGNLYANQAYDLLFPSLSSAGVSNFKIVAVATPADHVGGDGPYTTLLRDPIYLSGALADAIATKIGAPLVPPSLAWNVDNGPCVNNICDYSFAGTPTNFMFHDFTTSYLEGNVSGVKIVSDILAAIPPIKVGNVTITATLDGSLWSGAINYTITCASQSANGSTVPQTFNNEPVGVCTISNISGGPPNSALSGISPSASQDLSSGASLNYALSYVSDAPTAGFTMSVGGNSATDGQTLNFSPLPGGTVPVTFDSTSRSTAVNGGSIVGWSWTIGGTIAAHTSSFTHSFAAGAHTVSLVVTDNRGVSSPPVQGIVSITATNPPTSAQVTTLYSFPFTDGAFAGNGRNPAGPLTLGSDGLLYGTASGGGLYGNYLEANCYNSGCGTIFKIDTLGNFALLHQFSGADGAFPTTNLIQGKDGYFYGMTSSGGDPTNCKFNGGSAGCGTIFRIDSSGNLFHLYSFSGGSDGAQPVGGLVQGMDGLFYGATAAGGDLACIWSSETPGCGTIFRVDTAGNVTVLHQFGSTAADGGQPLAGLVQGTDGNFYGTTARGGISNDGTVFRVDTSGILTVLHSFSVSEGAYPAAALIQATDGAFYGTAQAGGTNSSGSVFKITASGTFTLLHSFTGLDGSNPHGSLVEGSGGFYGTTVGGGTNGEGTIIWMNSSGAINTLYSLSFSAGVQPYGGLTAIGTNFYGTTWSDGTNAFGTIYRVAQTYTAVDIGVGYPSGINNSGQIVGDTSQPEAFVYTGGTMFDLGFLPGGYRSTATSINNNGQVAWYSNTADGTNHALLYSGGITTNLGTLPGGSSSLAMGINDTCQIVGYSDTGIATHAFLYNGGTMTDLGTLPGGVGSEAFRINNSGQIVGYSYTGSSFGNAPHAFLYTNGTMTDLGTLPGGFESIAASINNSGQIVGYWSTYVGGIYYAFLYSEGAMRNLGTLPGGGSSEAYAINDSGEVVGTSTIADGVTSHAFLYGGGAMIDLNSLVTLPSGVFLTTASAINNLGQIAAFGSNNHAYILTPVGSPTP